MESIGQTIKDRRKMLSITQRELASLAGVGINTLTKIERDEANPSLDVLRRILDTLGLEITVQIKTNITKKPSYEKGRSALAGYARWRANRMLNGEK